MENTNKQDRKVQMSETFFVGALLAVTGGFLDAYTYIARGHVFANAQTGNMVLFGLNIAKFNWIEALYYLMPILAFSLGVIVAETIKAKFRNNNKIHWRQIIVAVEVIMLFVAAFIPSGQWDMAANIIISFVCAVQVETFRKLNGNAFATTMCTGNLRSATEALFHGIKQHNKSQVHKSLQYLGIIAFFICGAILGTVLTIFLGKTAVIACDLILIGTFALMFVEYK